MQQMLLCRAYQQHIALVYRSHMKSRCLTFMMTIYSYTTAKLLSSGTSLNPKPCVSALYLIGHVVVLQLPRTHPIIIVQDTMYDGSRKLQSQHVQEAQYSVGWFRPISSSAFS